MTSLKKYLLLFCCFTVASATAQTYNYNWDKTYGGNSRDWNSSIVKGTGNTFFLIGDSETNLSGDKNEPLCNPTINNSDIWLIKINASGSILWQKDFGGESDERAPQLVMLNNAAKEMIFACYTTSDIACDKSEANRDTIPLISADYWIALLDSNGVIIWEKTLGGDNYDDYTKVAILSTGEILVAGESNSPVGYDKTIPNYSISNDLWAVKLDMTGNIIGDFVYGGLGSELLAAIIPDNAGGFSLVGSTNSDISGDVSQIGQGNLDYWIIKVDALGAKVWDKRFGGLGPDQCNHAIQTPDNGYLLCGFTVSPQGGDVSQAPKGTQDYWVVKTDAIGNKQWDKRFGGTAGSFGTWVANANTGKFWVAGYSSSTNAIDVTEPSYGGSDYWLLQIDSFGTKLFDKRFGGNGNEFNASIISLNDTTFMAFGYSDSGSSVVKNAPSKGGHDYWLVNFKYNDGTVGINEFSAPSSQIQVNPNPSDGIFSVNFNTIITGDILIKIYDIAGKIIYRYHLENYLSETISIDLSGYDAGIYTLSIDDSRNFRVYSKVIVQ